MTTWENIRCRYCGAFLVKGRCPVSAKDCGRNRKTGRGER